jgi:hypothetical protein
MFSIISTILFDDRTWQAFGYGRFPKRGALFKWMDSRESREKETALLQELNLAYIATFFLIGSEALPPDGLLGAFVELLRIHLDGIPSSPSELWRTFRFTSREVAEEFYLDGLLQYLSNDKQSIEGDRTAVQFAKRYAERLGSKSGAGAALVDAIHAFKMQRRTLQKFFEEFVGCRRILSDLSGSRDFKDNNRAIWRTLQGVSFIATQSERQLTTKIARAFLSDQRIALDGFTSIDDSAAIVLARYNGTLELNGLAALSDASAEALAEHCGGIGLDGLGRLSLAAAKSLAVHDGGIGLNGLSTVSDDVIATLAEHNGYLSLNGLTKLSITAASALGMHEGYLGLSGISALTDEAVAELAEHNGDLSLRGLSELSDEAAEIFSQFKFVLSLDSLTTLSDEAARSLGRKKNIRLPYQYR